MSGPYPSVDVRQVANFFIESGGKTYSHLKIQKLVFFAHGWHLGLLDSPLIKERFEAWDYGPVVPALYKHLKKYGAEAVVDIFSESDFQSGPLADEQRSLLLAVSDSLGSLSASELTELAHSPDGPWAKCYKPGVYNVPIPDDKIKIAFKKNVR